MLTGNVYIRLFKPYDGKVLELQVKGKEKGSWIDKEGRWEGDGEHRHYVEYDVKRKGERDIIEAKVPIFNFPA